MPVRSLAKLSASGTATGRASGATRRQMSLAPWWAAANAEPPADEFKRDRAAATTSHNIDCQAAVDSMRRTAEAEMLKILDGIPVENVARA